MKIVGIEEHGATPDVVAAWLAQPPSQRDIAIAHSTGNEQEALLLDFAQKRIATMDAVGIDVAVLSLSSPGVQAMGPDAAVPLARATNDFIARAVRRRPDRFEGFATLPFGAPAEAARELERGVVELGLQGAMIFGRVDDRNLDHPDFEPVFETAARLRAPLVLHPQTPSLDARRAYYKGLGDDVESFFATAGIGWHYETGMQIVRLVLSGAFDRHPDLRVVVGHWGEVVLFYLDRIDMLSRVAKLPRPVSEYFTSQMYVMASGFLSHRCMRWATEVMGPDRVLFGTDYPFQIHEDGGARRFLEEADVTPVDREKLAHGNWDALVAGIRR